MHPCRVKIAKPGFPFLRLTPHKILCCTEKLLIHRFHTFFCKRTGIFNNLFSYLAELLIYYSIIIINGSASQYTTRAEFFAEGRIFRIVLIFRLFFSIEMIEITEKLIETMNGWQVFIAV